MICCRCSSNNVNVQVVNEVKGRSCLMSFLWVILAICTFGIWLLLIPLLTQSKGKTKTYAVCQTCGYKWKI